jgi:CCR4-NOT complex subunit CAF16
MRFGSFVTLPTSWPFSPAIDSTGPNTQLYNTALQWLKEDREFRRELEKKGRKVRGARKDDAVSALHDTVSKAC